MSEMLKIDTVKDADSFDFSYIFNKDDLQEIIAWNYEAERIREIDIKITLKGLKNDIPIFQKLHRLSEIEKKEVDKQLKIGLNDSIIKSNSEYISFIVLIKMKIVILKSDCRNEKKDNKIDIHYCYLGTN